MNFRKGEVQYSNPDKQLVFQERIVDSDIVAKYTGLKKGLETAVIVPWFGQDALIGH